MYPDCWVRIISDWVPSELAPEQRQVSEEVAERFGLIPVQLETLNGDEWKRRGRPLLTSEILYRLLKKNTSRTIYQLMIYHLCFRVS